MSAELSTPSAPAASLPFSLEMFAEELGPSRASRALRSLGRDLAHGRPWDEALDTRSRRLPPYIAGVFRVAVRSGRFVEAMTEYLVVLRRNRRIHRRLIGAFLYPALISAGAASLLVAFAVVLVPQMRALYNDFGVPLPGLTIVLLTIADFVASYWPIIFVIAGLGIALDLAWLIAPRMPGGAVAGRMMQRAPVIGTAAWLTAASEFCSLLAIQVDVGLPLPEALRLTRTGLRDANLRAGAKELATAVENGKDLHHAAQSLPHFRPQLAQVLSHADRGSVFAEVLRRQGLLFSLQADAQVGLATVWIEPFLLLAAGAGVGLIAIALFYPLFTLLSALA
jgi:type II secretory pathway component PulF